MEKKLYLSPLIEVAVVNMSATVLTGSPVDPSVPGPMPPSGPAGAPKRDPNLW